LLATRGDAPFASLRLSGAYSTIILAVLLCKFYEAKYLLPYLAYYYSRKQRIYLAFSRFLTFRSEANAVPNTKAINGLE